MHVSKVKYEQKWVKFVDDPMVMINDDDEGKWNPFNTYIFLSKDFVVTPLPPPLPTKISHNTL